MERKIIEFTRRPHLQPAQEYLAKVVEGTGIGIRKPALVQGNTYTWDYSDISDKDWNNAYPIIVGRLKTLHGMGALKYVSCTYPL